MPERSFGRTVRYRRTKLGMSQARLAELVGRSTSTIRAWERDKTRPNDPEVVATLAAILGIDERMLFEKAEVDMPEMVETSPTVEEALATLSIEEVPTDEEVVVVADAEPEPRPTVTFVEQFRFDLVDVGDGQESGGSTVEATVRQEAHVAVVDGPGFVTPPEPYVQTPLTPTVGEVSYMEDTSQRQVYRVRNLATLVAVIALVVVFIWALGEGLGALGDWWDDFFGNLRI
jgi:transcriptional regulator with XRE-family HTH domain